MKENELPYYGVGPYYCGSIIIVTIASIVLSYLNIIPKYSISGLGFIFNMLGIAMIITAIALWIWGALKSDIHDNIDNDQLITSGAYAYVRNPIYSAFLFLATGMIVFYGNIILFISSNRHDCILRQHHSVSAAYSLLGLIDRAHEKNRREMAGGEIRRRIQKIL